MTMEIKFTMSDAEFAVAEREVALKKIYEQDVKLMGEVLADHGLKGDVLVSPNISSMSRNLGIMADMRATFIEAKYSWLRGAIAIYGVHAHNGWWEFSFDLDLKEVAQHMWDGKIRPAP
jgi:hypothetical protein